MAYIQKSIPQPNRLYEFNISDFSGGLNNRTNLTAPNEASNMLNMTFYDTTVLEKRKGSKTFSDVVHPEPLTFLDEYKPYNDVPQIVRAGTSKMTINNSFSANLYYGDIDGENFLGMYFYTDGYLLRVYGQFPQVGDTFTRIIGTPTGSYRSLNVISTPSTYTPLDTNYTQGVTVYDYTGGRVWYEPCQNERDDPYRGYSVLPNKPRFITSLKGRLYLSGVKKDDDNVFISDPGNPFYFPPSLPLQVPPNSDSITGLVTYDNAVLVGRKEDLHSIIGDTNNPELGLDMFELRKLNAHAGFASNKLCNVAHNYLFFIGYDGNAYAMSSAKQDSQILSTTLLNKKVDFTTKPFALKQEEIITGAGFFYNNVWYVSIKDYVFCYHYLNQAWTVWNNLSIRSFHIKDYQLIWGNEAGQLMTFSEDYFDNGANPYYAFWESGYLTIGEPYTYKHFRDLYVVYDLYKGFKSSFHIKFELDYKWKELDYLLENQLAIWGESKFGDAWGSSERSASIPFTVGERARTIKIGVYADLKGLPMRVQQINGEYEIRGKR